MVTRTHAGLARLGAVALAVLSLGARVASAAKQTGPRPALSIPVAPLGYHPPGRIYLLSRFSSTSLDFLDATHLLFTFHEPRLLTREQKSNGLDQSIHAVVLDLATGNQTAEERWLLHDRGRYLWPLTRDRMLLRIGNRLYETDPSLQLKLVYNSPTLLQAVDVSPDGRMLMVQSDQERHTPEEHERLAQHAFEMGMDPPSEDVLVRMIQLEPPKLMLNAKSDHSGDVPATTEGYLTQEQLKPERWHIRFHPFEKPEPGGGDIVAEVQTSCHPDELFMNQSSVLVESCPPRRLDRFVAAYNLKGEKLWDGRWQSDFTWPTFRMARDGGTVGISWLAVGHPIAKYDTFDDHDVQAQVLTVLDSHTGGFRLAVPLDPVISAGGNFAISPDGKRLAVLNKGALEVYDLPPPAPPPPPQP